MKSLLLLHGAIGSSGQLHPIKNLLSNSFQIFTPNFSGHGGKPFNTQFSIEHFSQEIVDFINDQKLGPVNIFGYSMGGFVAMYLAKHFPHLIESVVTLATKFHWDEATANKEAGMLDAEKMEEKVPKFAAMLKERHHPNDWKVLLNKTQAMLKEMGVSIPLSLKEMAEIECPVLLMLGDRDNMVSLVETVSVFKQLKQGQLAVLPGTPHPLEQTDIENIASMITRFTH